MVPFQEVRLLRGNLRHDPANGKILQIEAGTNLRKQRRVEFVPFRRMRLSSQRVHGCRPQYNARVLIIIPMTRCRIVGCPRNFMVGLKPMSLATLSFYLKVVVHTGQLKSLSQSDDLGNVSSSGAIMLRHEVVMKTAP